MATSKLVLYNAALRHIGQRKLSALTEEGEGRRVLDDVYDTAIQYCLEQGQWNFAIRSQEIDYSPSVDPAFGYQYAFEKPDDWVRTTGLSTSEYFNPPLIQYVDENNYWWADVTPLYVRYVSNGTDYGLDLSLWPSTFERAVMLYLAYLIAPTLTNSDEKTDSLEKQFKRALTDARSKDAINDAVAFPPVGSWVNTRAGAGFTSRRYTRA